MLAVSHVRIEPEAFSDVVKPNTSLHSESRFILAYSFLGFVESTILDLS